MKNSYSKYISLILLLSISIVMMKCTQKGIVGPKVEESGEIYFPYVNLIGSNILNGLGDFKIDNNENTIKFPIDIYRGGGGDLNTFGVNIEVDNDPISGLIQSGKLPENTVVIDAGDYSLENTAEIEFKDGVMQGEISPTFKVPQLSKYAGKYAAVGIKVLNPEKFQINDEMNWVVLSFPVDSLVGPVYFPSAEDGSNSTLIQNKQDYSVNLDEKTASFSIAILRSGIADLADNNVTVAIDNSNIQNLIDQGKLPDNTLALQTDDIDFDGLVLMTAATNGMKGSFNFSIHSDDLAKYAGHAVAVGLKIAESKFDIDAERSQLAVYFDADEVQNLLAPRVNLIADINNWKKVLISNNENVKATINSQDNTIHFTGGQGFDQAGVYQSVQLAGGKTYQADFHVEGSGATDVWFEVWISQKKPQDGQDVTTDWDPTAKQILGLNTWSGCGNSPFSGQLASIGCTGNGGSFTAPSDGTYYFTIKSGGSNLGSAGILASGFSFK